MIEELDTQAGAPEELDEQEREHRRMLLQAGKRLIPQMWGMLRTLAMYDPENETPQRALDNLITSLDEVHADDEAAALIAFGDCAFLNGARLRLDSATYGVVKELSAYLEERSLGGLCFLRGLRRSRMMDFLVQLRSCNESETPREDLVKYLADAHIAEISLIHPRRIQSGEEEQTDLKLEAIEVYARAMHSLGNSGGARAAAARGRRQMVAVRRLVDLSERADETFLQLGTLQGVGPPLMDHSMNTTVLTLAMGRRLGFPRRHLLRLGIAAMNHNIGEAIPLEWIEAEQADTLTSMPTTLAEAGSVHAILGMRYMLDQYGVNFRILQRAIVAAEHHRHFDGEGGFPDLPPARPHLFARVIGVCDAYDTLTSPTEDRPALPPDQALKRLTRGANRLYDPILVKVFAAMVGRYPPGCLIELDSGDLAIVIARGEDENDQSRPRVLRIRDSMGAEVEPEVLDLSERIPGKRRYVASIVRTRDPFRMQIAINQYLFSPVASQQGKSGAPDAR